MITSTTFNAASRKGTRIKILGLVSPWSRSSLQKEVVLSKKVTSEFLVAEKNSSETDNTASHPTLEIDIGSQGSTNSKTNHKTGKRHKKITSKKNLDLHLFSINTNYLQSHKEHLATPWWLHGVLELNMVSWVISMQGGEFLTKVYSSRDATLLQYFPTPSSKLLSSFHPSSHAAARSKAIICWKEDRLFFPLKLFVKWLLPYPISFLSFQDWTIFAVFFITLDRVLSGNIKNTSRLRTCHCHLPMSKLTDKYLWLLPLWN